MKYMFVRLDVSTVCSTVCIYTTNVCRCRNAWLSCGGALRQCINMASQIYDLMASDCAIVILCLFLFPSFPGEFLGGF